MDGWISQYIDKEISRGEGEVPYSRMPTEKHRRNSGNRYSSLDSYHNDSLNRQELSMDAKSCGWRFHKTQCFWQMEIASPKLCNQIQWKHGKLSVAKPGRHCLGQIIKVSVTSGGVGWPRGTLDVILLRTRHHFSCILQECMVMGKHWLYHRPSERRPETEALKDLRSKKKDWGIVPAWRKLIRLDN